VKKWTEILLKSSDELEDAIQVLNRSGMRIALIVDSNKKLLGTLTDGDIRKALIKHTSMKCPVEKVMNSSPITSLFSDSPELIISKMNSKGLLHMPILDESGILIGLETLQNLISEKKHDNPVFIMAGGFGKRLRPLTEKKPKPLLNVGNKPILETIIMQFIDEGFYNFYISIHYKAEMIRDYFGDGSDWNINITYIYEDTPLGTAGSLGLLPDDFTKLPIIMMNADLITKVNFVQLLDFHNKQNTLATMCIREYNYQIPYGVIEIKDQNVVGIVEKPIKEFFINAGIYVLSPELISSIDGKSILDMPSLLNLHAKKGNQVSVFPIYEYWIDIGQMKEYKHAHKHFETGL
jgi:dTDP-glucose pyrophosphorylase/predicted transcriptional regulator